MTTVDLGPAADAMATMVRGVSADQLDAPTPCADYTVAALLDHIGGLTKAFTHAATKTGKTFGTSTPVGHAEALDPTWQSSIPEDLAELVQAWRDPLAWTGMTAAGPFEMPGEIAGLVVLDELVLHGWDLARATGQELPTDPASLEASLGVLGQFQQPGKVAEPGAAFGTVLDTPDDAPLLDRVLAFSGRDPSWSAEA